MKNNFEVGDLVRTIHKSKDGVYRDVVKRVYVENGEQMISGSTWTFPAKEMEIIRKNI